MSETGTGEADDSSEVRTVEADDLSETRTEGADDLSEAREEAGRLVVNAILPFEEVERKRRGGWWLRSRARLW